tara:strand:- start:379 stop:1500 length:1122 start_codon:yes stop_codon:yes gene_type:complete
VISKFFSLDDSLQRNEKKYGGKKTKYFIQKIKIVFSLIKKGKISLPKLFNVFVSFYSYLFKLKKSGKTPVVIDFELSNKCNERCVFCRDEKGNIFDVNPESNKDKFIEKGRLDFEIFKNIVEEVKKNTLLIIPYVNGEPFIYKHLDKILNLLKVNKMGSMLSSNGILLNDKNIDLILSEDLDQIKVHVSGFTNAIHQIQHRLGDVEIIKKNLINLSNKIKLKNSSLIVLVDYILYEHNKHELEEFKKFTENLGFDFNIRPGNPKGMEEKEKPQPEISAINIPCEWLWKVMTINWNGDLLPCCEYVTWNGSGGYANYVVDQDKKNLSPLKKTNSVIDTWNGDKIINMRMIHRSEGRAPIPICAGCNKTGIEYKY